MKVDRACMGDLGALRRLLTPDATSRWPPNRATALETTSPDYDEDSEAVVRDGLSDDSHTVAAAAAAAAAELASQIVPSRAFRATAARVAPAEERHEEPAHRQHKVWKATATTLTTIAEDSEDASDVDSCETIEEVKREISPTELHKDNYDSQFLTTGSSQTPSLLRMPPRLSAPGVGTTPSARILREEGPAAARRVVTRRGAHSEGNDDPGSIAEDSEDASDVDSCETIEEVKREISPTELHKDNYDSQFLTTGSSQTPSLLRMPPRLSAPGVGTTPSARILREEGPAAARRVVTRRGAHSEGNDDPGSIAEDSEDASDVDSCETIEEVKREISPTELYKDNYDSQFLTTGSSQTPSLLRMPPRLSTPGVGTTPSARILREEGPAAARRVVTRRGAHSEGNDDPGSIAEDSEDASDVDSCETIEEVKREISPTELHKDNYDSQFLTTGSSQTPSLLRMPPRLSAPGVGTTPSARILREEGPAAARRVVTRRCAHSEGNDDPGSIAEDSEDASDVDSCETIEEVKREISPTELYKDNYDSQFLTTGSSQTPSLLRMPPRLSAPGVGTTPSARILREEGPAAARRVVTRRGAHSEGNDDPGSVSSAVTLPPALGSGDSQACQGKNVAPEGKGETSNEKKSRRASKASMSYASRDDGYLKMPEPSSAPLPYRSSRYHPVRSSPNDDQPRVPTTVQTQPLPSQQQQQKLRPLNHSPITFKSPASSTVDPKDDWAQPQFEDVHVQPVAAPESPHIEQSSGSSASPYSSDSPPPTVARPEAAPPRDDLGAKAGASTVDEDPPSGVDESRKKALSWRSRTPVPSTVLKRSALLQLRAMSRPPVQPVPTTVAMPTETSRELLPPTSPLGQEMAKSSAGATSALGVKPGGLVRPSSRNGDAGGALLGGSSPCSSLAPAAEEGGCVGTVVRDAAVEPTAAVAGEGWGAGWDQQKSLAREAVRVERRAVGDVGGEHQAVAEAFGSNCIAGVRLVVEWLGSVEVSGRSPAVWIFFSSVFFCISGFGGRESRRVADGLMCPRRPFCCGMKTRYIHDAGHGSRG